MPGGILRRPKRRNYNGIFFISQKLSIKRRFFPFSREILHFRRLNIPPGGYIKTTKTENFLGSREILLFSDDFGAKKYLSESKKGEFSVFAVLIMCVSIGSLSRIQFFCKRRNLRVWWKVQPAVGQCWKLLLTLTVNINLKKNEIKNFLNFFFSKFWLFEVLLA